MASKPPQVQLWGSDSCCPNNPKNPFGSSIYRVFRFTALFGGILSGIYAGIQNNKSYQIQIKAQTNYIRDRYNETYEKVKATNTNSYKDLKEALNSPDLKSKEIHNVLQDILPISTK